MPGLGTLINVLCIVAGGVIGALFGRFVTSEQQDALCKVPGVSVLFTHITSCRIYGAVDYAEEVRMQDVVAQLRAYQSSFA